MVKKEGELSEKDANPVKGSTLRAEASRDDACNEWLADGLVVELRASRRAQPTDGTVHGTPCFSGQPHQKLYRQAGGSGQDLIRASYVTFISPLQLQLPGIEKRSTESKSHRRCCLVARVQPTSKNPAVMPWQRAI
jgi:hypothetical protein